MSMYAIDPNIGPDPIGRQELSNVVGSNHLISGVTSDIEVSLDCTIAARVILQPRGFCA